MFIGRDFHFKTLYDFAKQHASPNAGYPITAMAMIQGIALGGPTSYHGVSVEKTYFGDGRKEIVDKDILATLRVRRWIDIIVLGSFGILYLTLWV